MQSRPFLWHWFLDAIKWKLLIVFIEPDSAVDSSSSENSSM
jgi:hypothetical protein